MQEYTYVYITTIDKKEAMDLKNSKMGDIWGRLERGKERKGQMT